MNPASRRQSVETVIEKLGVSERQACKALGQHRSTQRYDLKMPEKDRLLTEAIREQANKRKHRRYGYRPVPADTRMTLRPLGYPPAPPSPAL